MDALVIHGPAELSGTVDVSGSKNSALPLLFMSILSDSEVHYRNVPRLWDIETTLKILEFMGCETEWDKVNGRVSVLPLVRHPIAPYEWVRKMRAGILALGPLVAKYGRAKVSLPGGCAIGARPVNFHIEALKQFGVKINVEQGYICAEVETELNPADITFPMVTVTGTANAMIVAAFAKGKSVIRQAACEPEVVVIGEVLRRMGIVIDGLGTNTLVVHGGTVGELEGEIEIPYDRIEAGTWIAAAAATQSALVIRHCPRNHMKSVISVYEKMGMHFQWDENAMTLSIAKPSGLKPVTVETAPYPGFPTDMQAQLLVSLLAVEGTSQIKETIFENRFMHVAELRRLGAEIDVEGNVAKIRGGRKLKGAPMMATDLRASASLVLAGLCAEGKTTVSRLYHLDRGYDKLDHKLAALGVHVERIQE